MSIKITLKSKNSRNVSTTSTRSPNSYTIPSFESRPWSSTSVTVSRPKTRRARPEPVIVNPIFKECAELTTDTMWKSIFNEAALGKLPRGFSFKNGYITHKIRNKVSRLEISDNPSVVLNECIDFFREKAGIMSQEDQKRAKESFEDYLLSTKELYPTKWSAIRKKKIKNALISTYMAKVGKDLHLNQEEKGDLKNTIYLGFILGCFGNNQVELKEGYIHEIIGLEFNEETRKFYIDYSRAPKQIKRSRRNEKEVKPKDSFYLFWLKFLNTLERKSMKGKSASSKVPSSLDEEEPGTPDDSESSSI
jgi:hypothetical protein